MPNKKTYRIPQQIFLGLLLILILTSCQTAGDDFLTSDERDWLQQYQGNLEVLFGYEAPPNAYLDDNEQYVGLLVDFLREIEGHVGSKFVSRDFETWDELIEYSKTRRNFVIVGIARTDARAEYLSFTDSFIKVPYVIVTRKTSELTTMSDLVDSRVCTVANYAVNDYIARYFPLISPAGVADNLEGLRAVSTGDCDAMVVNQMYASYLIENQGITNLKIAGESGYLNRLSAAVSINDPELFNILDKAVDQIDPARQQKLYRKWVSAASTGLSQSVMTILGVAAGGAAALLALLWLWSVSLRRQINKQTRQIRESEEKFRSYVENAPNGIFVADEKGDYVEVNKAAEKITGYSRRELLKMNLTELIPTGDQQKAQKHFESVVKAGKFASDLSFIKKDGSLNYWTIDAVKLSDNRFLGFVTDITERKRTEEEKDKLESQLRQAHKMEAIGTLAGGIAHDFNNILGMIIGYADMAIEDAPADSKFSHDLDKILQASHRAKDLVKQILAFSRQAQVEKKSLNPQPIIKEALKMLRSSIPTTIEIQENISDECGNIDADPTQVHQILMNLCTNAFHAMEEKGGILRVDLQVADSIPLELKKGKLEAEEVFIRLSISDTGIGIDPELVDKIFDPFFTTKVKGKGTGMGLAIIYGIVKEYGGTITVDTQLGKGTTFHIYLPQSKHEEVRTLSGESAVPKGRERILYVDDEEYMADMAKNMLERLGYNVIVKLKSFECLELFQSQPDKFDLVITDQTMPGMTGLDLAGKMLQIRPDIPIILCTGYSTGVNEEVAKAEGIKGFTLKPFTRSTIANLIRQVLDENASGIH